MVFQAINVYLSLIIATLFYSKSLFYGLKGRIRKTDLEQTFYETMAPPPTVDIYGMQLVSV